MLLNSGYNSYRKFSLLAWILCFDGKPAWIDQNQIYVFQRQIHPLSRKLLVFKGLPTKNYSYVDNVTRHIQPKHMEMYCSSVTRLRIGAQDTTSYKLGSFKSWRLKLRFPRKGQLRALLCGETLNRDWKKIYTKYIYV